MGLLNPCIPRFFEVKWGKTLSGRRIFTRRKGGENLAAEKCELLRGYFPKSVYQDVS
jgi:hypothetical protein